MSEPVIPGTGKRVDFNIVSYDQWRMRAEAAESRVAEQQRIIERSKDRDLLKAAVNRYAKELSKARRQLKEILDV